MAIRSTAWKQFRDEDLRIALGLYPSLSQVRVFGRNRNCADGTEEEIYSTENAATFPATALMTKLSQTTDQAGARGDSVRIVGLDINYDEVTQDVVLNASNTTTAVTLDPALLRVNSMRILDTPIDQTVRLHNTAENVDYAVVLVGENRSTQAHYTVPNNKTAYMTKYFVHRNQSAIVAADTVDFQLYEVDNANSGPETLIESNLIEPLVDGNRIVRSFSPYRKFGEHTDIIMTATAASTVADVSAGFDLILVDDNDN